MNRKSARHLPRPTLLELKRATRKHRPARAPRCNCDYCQMKRDVLAAGGSVEADGTFTVDADWFRANFTKVED